MSGNRTRNLCTTRRNRLDICETYYSVTNVYPIRLWRHNLWQYWIINFIEFQIESNIWSETFHYDLLYRFLESILLDDKLKYKKRHDAYFVELFLIQTDIGGLFRRLGYHYVDRIIFYLWYSLTSVSAKKYFGLVAGTIELSKMSPLGLAWLVKHSLTSLCGFSSDVDVFL